MRKITDMLIEDKDPTNEYQDQLIELLHEVKIKLIKYEDNEEISDNLFNMLKIFFNDIVIKNLIESIYPEQRVKQLMRQHIIDEILRLFKVGNATQIDMNSIYHLLKKYVRPGAIMYQVNCNCQTSISAYYQALCEWYANNAELFNQKITETNDEGSTSSSKSTNQKK